MKRKEILVLIGEVLGSRAVYSVASLVITITMLSGITIVLRNDIRDIKNYVQSVVDGDPNYKEVHEQVSGSENVIKGNIDVEAFLAKEDNKSETTSVASDVNNGYNSYTPAQTITDNSSNKPASGVNNSYNSGTTTVANNNNNGNSNNITNGESVNNNSGESKKEEILDRSSFNGKDIMISEGEPFNPMNALQLAATDINGKNITNKIVITENNVDTYKPGLYTVKANVTLSNESTLEKEFLVRVESTILNLAVNDLKISKDVLKKNEHFNLAFAVKSSKSYLEVASVNINNEDYVVNKTASSSFFRTSNKYEVDLVAPSKAGTEKIEIKSVTMSDGTIVDVNKSVNVEVLKEEAHIIDAVVKNITSEDEDMFLEYNLEDVDNVLNEAFLYLYDENDVLIQQEELEKNNKSSINLNINKNGKYKVQIKGYYKTDINTRSDFYNEKELFTQDLEINKFNSDNALEDDGLMLTSIEYNEDYNSYDEVGENIFRKERTVNSTIQLDKEKSYKVHITGNIADYKGDIVPGTVSVTVPTAVSFNVNAETGNINSAEMTIINHSEEKVVVIASEFTDTTGNLGIELKKETDISKNSQRGHVALKLIGGTRTIFFTSEQKDGRNGKIYDASTNDEIALNTQIGEVTKDNPLKLRLEGKGGTYGDNTIPIKDNFQLILKIKKSEKN